MNLEQYKQQVRERFEEEVFDLHTMGCETDDDAICKMRKTQLLDNFDQEIDNAIRFGLEMVEEWQKDKRELFEVASHGTLESSNYARAVVTTLNDLSIGIEQLKANLE